MPYKKYLIFFFSFVVNGSAYGQAGSDMCRNRLEDKKMEQQFNLEPKTPPVNKQMAPFDFDTKWGKLSTVENYRGISGYYCDSVSNHPTIYASGSGYTVVGSAYEKKFKASELQLAIEAYKKLLISSGYLK